MLQNFIEKSLGGAAPLPWLLVLFKAVYLIWFLPVIWKLDKGWFLWAVVLGVVPAVSGTFTSYARFESVVFPLFVALAVLLARHEWLLLRWVALLVFTAGHVFLLWRFVTHGWVG